MPRFLTGDELGNIKSISCTQNPEANNEWKLDERVLFAPSTHAQMNSGDIDAEKAKSNVIQRLATSTISEKAVLAAARANGALSAFSVNPEDGKLEVLKEWKETRFKASHKYVGLDLSRRGLFWCTSNGALGFSGVDSETKDAAPIPSTYQKASLPMRLCAWHLSPDASSFAYGGQEVDLSVWDTERAFQNNAASSKEKDNESKKRKRGGDLFPGEVWRAKNLPNDALSLRQPIHITSLSYLPSNTSSPSNVHIATGTETGDVRRYDTRAARKPVANWTGIGKVGGVGVVQAGASEHELFVADNGTNLSVLDLRTGKTLYTYKKLQGAVNSLASSLTSDGFLGSTSRDRFFRLHTTAPPPETAGRNLEERGDVVGSAYMKSIPTTVVFDESGGAFGPLKGSKGAEDDSDNLGEDDEDVWAEMEDVDDSDEEGERRQKGKRRS